MRENRDYARRIFSMGLPLAKFIHQLVHVPDVSHQRVFDLLDSNPANHASDLADVGMERRRLLEEGLEVLLPLDLRRQRMRSAPRQPADDLIQFLLLAPLLLDLLYVEWIHSQMTS